MNVDGVKCEHRYLSFSRKNWFERLENLLLSTIIINRWIR